MIGMTRVMMILRRKKRGRRSSSLVTSNGLKRSCGTSSHGDLRKLRSLVGIGEVFVMSSSCESLPNSATKCTAVAVAAATITAGTTGATVPTLLPPTAWRLVKPQVSTWSIIMPIPPLLAHRGASPPKSYRPSSSPAADVVEAIVITITTTIHPIFMFQCLHRVPLPRPWMRIGVLLASMLVPVPIMVAVVVITGIITILLPLLLRSNTIFHRPILQ
mmetsp:Transcript_37853/g.68186  ORF Transcript_37853/g.68186 Transcript_37853/m.68186 type:complete len:217 (-) Transcript_37853:367-1017(-)